jgi:hypothetical protein
MILNASEERLFEVGCTLNFLARLGSEPCCRQIDGLGDSQQRHQGAPDALVLVSRTHKDEVELVSDNTFTQDALSASRRNLFFHEDKFGQLIIKDRSSVKQLLALLGCNSANSSGIASIRSG